MKAMQLNLNVLIGLLMLCMATLCLAESSLLLDPKERIDEVMRAEMESAQKKFWSDYSCRVSYVIDAGDSNKGEMKAAWHKHAVNDGENFHLLVLIGDYSESKSVKIQTNHLPAL